MKKKLGKLEKRKFYKRGMLLWLLIAVICFMLGVFDDGVLYPSIGEIAISITGILMSIAIFLIAVIALPKLPRVLTKDYWMLGLMWLGMTVVFEVAEGISIEGASLHRMLNAYNPSTGNLWLLVVLSALFSPILVSKIKDLKGARDE